MTVVVCMATITGSGQAGGSSAEGSSLAQAESPGGTRLTIHGDPPDPTDVSNELKKVYQHIDANFEAHVARLQEWVRIPSISNTVEGKPAIWKSAGFIRDVIINELGCEARIYAPGMGEWGRPGHPVVYGRCDVGAERTIIDYMQGDVMPVWPDKEDEWEAPPFGGQIIEKPPFKRILIGRGSNNEKGPDMAQLNAMISIKAATGTLPVNVIVVVDHDEERMETGLRTFMFNHRELFEGAEAMFAYGGTQMRDGRGRVDGQSVGHLVFDLETSGYRGGASGGSGAAGRGQQPLWRHVKMVATMYGNDPSGTDVLIEGLADNIEPPSAAEVEYIRREAQLTGRSFESLMSVRTRVRVNMTGIWGGNMAPGYAGHITPETITSKHDIRFPPKVEGEDVLRKIRAHLDRHGYEDAKIKVVGITPWSWANYDNDLGRAVLQMYDQFGVPYNPPPKGNFMGRQTAAGPPYLFTREPLQIPVAYAGLGSGYWGGAHYGQEFYLIEGDGEKIYGFAGAMKAYATVLYNYAGKNRVASESAR